jgi:hypothetical protein
VANLFPSVTPLAYALDVGLKRRSPLRAKIGSASMANLVDYTHRTLDSIANVSR